MPELPEVEQYKRYINSTSMQKTIKGVKVTDDRILDGISAGDLAKKVKGKKFLSSKRRGKYLFLETSGSHWLYLHFGMTGDVKYYKTDKDPDHSRVLFSFHNGYRLSFVNSRLFGKIGAVAAPEDFIEKKNMGLDALDIGYDKFREEMEGKTGSVKSALMDQSAVAGVGNIYSDEILFQARVHPRSRPRDLDRNEIKRIFRNMKKVLSKAVEKKGDPERFPRSWLIPSRDSSAECPRCGAEVQRVKISGRSGYFCPSCQKK